MSSWASLPAVNTDSTTTEEIMDTNLKKMLTEMWADLKLREKDAIRREKEVTEREKVVEEKEKKLDGSIEEIKKTVAAVIREEMGTSNAEMMNRIKKMETEMEQMTAKMDCDCGKALNGSPTREKMTSLGKLEASTTEEGHATTPNKEGEPIVEKIDAEVLEEFKKYFSNSLYAFYDYVEPIDYASLLEQDIAALMWQSGVSRQQTIQALRDAKFHTFDAIEAVSAMGVENAQSPKAIPREVVAEFRATMANNTPDALIDVEGCGLDYSTLSKLLETDVDLLMQCKGVNRDRAIQSLRYANFDLFKAVKAIEHNEDVDFGKNYSVKPNPLQTFIEKMATIQNANKASIAGQTIDFEEAARAARSCKISVDVLEEFKEAITNTPRAPIENADFPMPIRYSGIDKLLEEDIDQLMNMTGVDRARAIQALRYTNFVIVDAVEAIKHDKDVDFYTEYSIKQNKLQDNIEQLARKENGSKVVMQSDLLGIEGVTKENVHRILLNAGYVMNFSKTGDDVEFIKRSLNSDIDATEVKPVEYAGYISGGQFQFSLPETGVARMDPVDAPAHADNDVDAVEALIDISDPASDFRQNEKEQEKDDVDSSDEYEELTIDKFDDKTRDAQGLAEVDIDLVMYQANVSRNEAIMALRTADNDIVDAIMALIM